MRFPGTRMLLLLLSLAAPRCLADHEAVTKMGVTAALNKDPDSVAHDVHEKTSNVTIMKHSAIITEFSTEVEKNVVVEQPTSVELSCELSIEESKVQGPDTEVMWKHDEEDINSTDFTFSRTGAQWHTLYKFYVRDGSMLGNYTCIFKATLEAKATFHLKVPKIKGGDKPMVSYERDTVVMKCDTAKHKPVAWIWYRSDGTNKVAINDSLMPSKYEVVRKRVNETKLHINELSGNDSGLYWCEAVFPVGESRAQINLNVLSYMVPLKPFLCIAAEVIVLVAIILIYEMKTKKKESLTEDEKEVEQTEHLKPDEVNGVENDTTRHRKV